MAALMCRYYFLTGSTKAAIFETRIPEKLFHRKRPGGHVHSQTKRVGDGGRWVPRSTGLVTTLSTGLKSELLQRK